jgi:hypothetical protein
MDLAGAEVGCHFWAVANRKPGEAIFDLTMTALAV